MDYLYSPFQDVWANGYITSESASKEFKTSSKTEDEMKKLTMDENLTDIQKASLIFSKGQSFQKYSVYYQLPKLLKEPEAQGRFLQLIFEDIQTQEEDLQIEAAKAFSIVLREKTLDKNNEMKLFSIALNIFKIWSQPILLAWVEVFQEIINVFHFPSIEKDCNQLIAILSDHSQPKTSRYIAGNLIGIVSEKMKEGFTSNLMERVRALCQDSDIEIRKLMAKEVLEKICFSIGPEKTEIYILEKIMELVYDGEITVKCAGITLVFRIIDAFSPEVKSNRIATLFIELLASINEEVLKVISRQIGFIVSKLETYLKKNPSYISSILSTFKEYGMSKNEEIRKNFTFNLSAILSLIDPKQFDSYKTIYLNHLLHEKNLEMRQTAVASLHEILKLIGWEETHKIFKDILKILCKETNISLLKKLVEHLNEILEAFYHDEIWLNEEYINNFQDILGYVMQLGARLHKENQWRIQERLLKEFMKELKYFKMIDLNEKYWPFLQNLLKNGVWEIRSCACLSLVKFLKVNYYEKKRLEIVKHVNEHFFKSKSYFHRMVYLEFLYHSTIHFSQHFLKINFIPDCFKLSIDRVPNIRRKLATIMINIRRRLSANDNDNLARFNETISVLKKDIDLDVLDSSNKMIASLDQLKLADPDFIKEQESFEKERNIEEEELRITELREIEETKKKDSIDLDLFYPSPYYSSILCKTKGKTKVPNSAGLGNYRFNSKNLNSSPNVALLPMTVNTKLKSSKDITGYSPLSKTNSAGIQNNTLSFSPQPIHKTTLIMQNSERNVINMKKVFDDKKKDKEIRDLHSSSKVSKPIFEAKLTKFSTITDKEKDKKHLSPLKKELKKI